MWQNKMIAALVVSLRVFTKAENKKAICLITGNWEFQGGKIKRWEVSKQNKKNYSPLAVKTAMSKATRATVTMARETMVSKMTKWCKTMEIVRETMGTVSQLMETVCKQ